MMRENFILSKLSAARDAHRAALRVLRETPTVQHYVCCARRPARSNTCAARDAHRAASIPKLLCSSPLCIYMRTITQKFRILRDLYKPSDFEDLWKWRPYFEFVITLRDRVGFRRDKNRWKEENLLFPTVFVPSKSDTIWSGKRRIRNRDAKRVYKCQTRLNTFTRVYAPLSNI